MLKHSLKSLLNKKRFTKREKLEIVMAMRMLLTKLGDYENVLDGLIGEIYAEHKFNLVKSKAYTKNIDGLINGKRTQIKTKGGKKKYSNSQHYIEINNSARDSIDALLMVVINAKSKIRSFGPFDRAKCDSYSKLQTNGRRRYYLNRMIETSTF